MEEVCLTIKAPNQKYEDLKINCQLSWTILDLKIYLCKEYPSKPHISDQRLIYSGHLLKDEQSLRDIIQLSDDNDTYTFHLVCPQRPAPTPPTATAPASESANKSSAPGTSTTSSDTSQAAEMPLNGMNAAFRQVSPDNASPAAVPFQANHLGSNNGGDMHDSYQAMMNQYYQYMSYYYLASPPPAIDYASYYAFANAYLRGMNQNVAGMPTFNVANDTPNQNQNGANENQVNVNANRNANNANNNQADNDEMNRDWTDMLYSFSKAMVMFSIMYFYSSFGRLLLLITIALILYLYKSARLVGVQNILNNDNNNNNEQDNGREQQAGVAEQPLNNNEANNENRESEGQESRDEVEGGSNEPNGAVQENSRYTGLRLVWVFVSSLFTSLIPDPTPIN